MPRQLVVGGRILKAFPLAILLIAALGSVKLAGPILQNESVKVVGFLQGYSKTVWPSAHLKSHAESVVVGTVYRFNFSQLFIFFSSLSWGKNDVILWVAEF